MPIGGLTGALKSFRFLILLILFPAKINIKNKIIHSTRYSADIANGPRNSAKNGAAVFNDNMIITARISDTMDAARK